MAKGKKKDKKTRVRFAVVGLGHFAQVAVLPAFDGCKRAELVALFSDQPEKLKKLGKKYKVGELHGYEQLDEVLASGDIDAVYITVPNSLHREYVERAARAGVHVLCEKPLAHTEADCRAMIDACASRGRKLMVAYRLHFEKTNLSAIEIAHGQGKKGKLGELRSFTSTFSFQVEDDNIRVKKATGGGPLLDIGVYCINAARYLFREEPTEVVAMSATRSGDARFAEVPEQVSVALRFPHERLATFTVGFGAADAGWYEVVGTEGRLRVDPAYDYVGELGYELTVNGKTKSKTFRARDQIAGEIDYFAECILEDRQPEPSGEEGLADVRVVEAIERALSTGRAVKIEPVRKRERPSKQQERQRPPHGEPQTVQVEAPTQ